MLRVLLLVVVVVWGSSRLVARGGLNTWERADVVLVDHGQPCRRGTTLIGLARCGGGGRLGRGRPLGLFCD